MVDRGEKKIKNNIEYNGRKHPLPQMCQALPRLPPRQLSLTVFVYCLPIKKTVRDNCMIRGIKKETAERRLKREKRVKYHPKCVKPCRDSRRISHISHFLLLFRIITNAICDLYDRTKKKCIYIIINTLVVRFFVSFVFMGNTVIFLDLYEKHIYNSASTTLFNLMCVTQPVARSKHTVKNFMYLCILKIFNANINSTHFQENVFYKNYINIMYL